MICRAIGIRAISVYRENLFRLKGLMPLVILGRKSAITRSAMIKL